MDRAKQVVPTAIVGAAAGGRESPASTWQEISGGWRIILAAFLPVALHSLPNYGLGALIEPIANDFNVEVSRVTAWSLFWSAGAIACAAFVGSAVDRWGARKVVLFGLPIYSIVLVSLSALSVTLSIFLGFAFLTGIACTMIGSIPGGRLLADRFDTGLGTAFGLMATGIGVAALAGPIVLQQLADRFGWQSGYAVMAIAALITLPVFWLATNDSANAARPVRAEKQLGIWHFVQMPAFLFMAAGTFLFGLVVTGASVSMIMFLGSHGFSRAEAAVFSGLFGISTIAGRLLTGLALDRISLHIADFTALVLAGLACCFFLMSATYVPIVLVSVALFGFAVGAEADCLSYSVVRLFGRDVFGRLYGLLGVGALLAGAGFGPLIFNLIVEQVGNYGVAFRAWGVITLVSALLFFCVRKTPYAEQGVIA